MSKTLKALLFAAILAVAVSSALLPVAAEVTEQPAASADPAVSAIADPVESGAPEEIVPVSDLKDPTIVWTASEEMLDVGDEVEITVSIVGLNSPEVKDIRGMQVNVGYDPARMEWIEESGKEMLLAHVEENGHFVDVGHNKKTNEIIFLYANMNKEEAYFPRDNTVLFRFKCKMVSKVGPGTLEFPINRFQLQYSDKEKYQPTITDIPGIGVIDPVSPPPEEPISPNTNSMGWIVIVVGVAIAAAAVVFIILRSKKAKPEGVPKPVKEKPQYEINDDEDEDDEDLD